MKRTYNLHSQIFVILALVFLATATHAQEEKPLNLNKPEREQWFTELGFGMFIHWSMDVQLGMVISHSMVGASEQYLDRYVNELPKTFNPVNFDATQWANAARQAGMKYMVFTSKHHNGYCMFDTKTTDFGIMHSPYGKDVTKMLIEACREAGLAVGLYFSPDDFHFLYQQGTLISRDRKEACYTLGDQWQYRPTNEHYKTAKEAILKLIDIRAKGGNLLLNFGPDKLGNFPPEQLGILNEILLWMFINQEAFEQTIPHHTVKEDNMWFLTSQDKKNVYVFINEDNWKFGERKVFRISEFNTTKFSSISVLGHNGKVLEYQPDVNPAPLMKQTKDGIELTITRAQRIYNDRKWNNPIVVKIIGVN